MSFEWQTEEDHNWDEEPALPKPPQRVRRRWPWLVLATVVVVGTAVFLLYRQINRRVEAATDDIEADLVASYAVLQQAAQDKDENLFNSLLSGRDPEWSLAQRANVANGALFDRTAFGLTWQPVLAETAVISQTFSPELTSAELTTLQNYSLAIGNGLTQTVQLRRVDVYRLGEDRWLYAPPEAEFWGVRRRLDGQLVSVRYPARDEAMVHRLAADLEARLVQVCNTPGFTCPEDAEVRLFFSAEPDSLTHFTFLDALTEDPESDDSVWAGGATVVLPTPTLVGLPQDETGYQALLRGYEAYLLTIVLNDLIGWTCCENVLFYRAAIERQLYELGVGEWPLAGTAVSLPDELYLLNVADDWNAPFPEAATGFAAAPMPYITIDFLVDSFDLAPAHIGQALVGSSLFDFSQWFADLTGPPWTEATLNQTFRQYVARWQSSPTAQRVPEDGLTLLCHDPLHMTQGLYYFDFALEQPLLLEGLPYDELLHFTGLPGGEGLAVVARESPKSDPETYLLRNGEQQIDVNWANIPGLTAYPPLAIPTITDRNGRYLLWTVTEGFADGTVYAVNDLAECREGSACTAVALGGYPVWSPTLENLITLTVTDPWWTEGLTNGLIMLRSDPTDFAAASPGFGASVFWIDEADFGYINQFQNGLQHLVLTDAGLSRPFTLFTNNSLRDTLSGTERPDALTIELVQPLPTDPRILVVVAQGNSNLAAEPATGHLFWYDRVADSVRLSVPLPAWSGSGPPGYRFSPDGRFMLLTFDDEDEAGAHMLLQDSVGPRFQNFYLEGRSALPRHFYASWTSDGEWLALPELGYIRLWHDGSDEQILNFDGLNCTNAAWVDRMEP